MKIISKIMLNIVLILCFTTTIFAGNNWVNINLNYDGKAHNYSEEKIDISINGKIINSYNIEPIILNNRALVPLRDVFEKLGAKISWNNETRSILVQKNNNKIVFKVDDNKATKNNNKIINLDVPAKIINDYTMIPIRAISDSLGYLVSWDKNTRTVVIKDDKSTIKDTDTNKVKEPNKVIETQANVKSSNITMLWDQTYISHNDLPEKRIPVDGLNVLSPTWFAIKDSNGTIEDKGSLSYAKWANDKGYKLWGLVSNSFSSKITKDVLSNSKKVDFVISQLLTYAKKYNLDGINIDFENLGKSDTNIYVNFIKKATKILKENGLTVSVDMYMPTPWTKHYNMQEVAKIVDYVVIMAYDEHYRTSKTSGSTASLPWVSKYMKIAKGLVPADKLIMGVPFYTRVWSEKLDANGKIEVVESVAVTMDEAVELISKNNAKVVWLEDIGQEYATWNENGVTKKLWLENEKSIKKRMELAKELGVKGLAFWKRGYENPNIWNIINNFK